MCYCETNLKKLLDGVAALQEQIPQIESSIEEAVGTKAQLESDLAKAKKDREDAKAAIADATAQREKEKAAFDAEDAEDKANIAACGKAITAIEKGMAAMFLQSGSANTLKNIVINRDLDRYPRRA